MQEKKFKESQKTKKEPNEKGKGMDEDRNLVS